MIKRSKKWFITQLRSFGYRANYSNISWFYRADFKIVGGILYLTRGKLYFCLNSFGDGVIIDCSYVDDIRPLIYDRDGNFLVG